VTVIDKARQGTRNRTAGLGFNRGTVIFLRPWWPAAERQLHAHRSDIAGIGDLAVETTIEPWAQIWKKMRQAQADAERRGVGIYCVVKKHNRAPGDPGSADPGEAAAVFRAKVIFPALARLQWLETVWGRVVRDYPDIADRAEGLS
jgi:hypothetical protein